MERRDEVDRGHAIIESATPKAYVFGPFRLEVAERRLLRDGELVPLTGKAFDTLQVLVEKAGTLQKQQSLMDQLWPNVFVEPNNLQYNISLVRHALAGAPGIEIQTVRGQGYRLIADVRAAAPARSASASLRPVSAGAQRVHFCRAPDGTRLAYALLGDGPPLVKAAHWLSHLELDRQGPLWTHWLDLLSRNRLLLRYDARGNGLSDWDAPSLTFEDFASDFGTIFDAAGIERAPGRTFRWAGEYSGDMSEAKTLDTQLNVFESFAPKIPDKYLESDFVFLANIHPGLQLQVREQLPHAKLVGLDTMNYWINGTPEELRRILARVDLLVINDKEVRMLAGIDNLRRAAAVVRKMGPRWLVVKRGEFGACLFQQDSIFFVPGYPLEEVHDPTGAGDTFAGVLAAGLDRNLDFDKALSQASVAAALACLTIGAQPAMPDCAAIDAALIRL